MATTPVTPVDTTTEDVGGVTSPVDALKAAIQVRLLECVPGARNVPLDDDISQVLSLPQRALLHSFARLLAPEIDSRLLSGISSIPELVEWLALAIDDGRGSLSYLAPHTGIGSTVRLRPLEPSDVSLLYRAAFEPAVSERWRFRGRTTSLAAFEQMLYEGVLSQYLACPLDSPEPVAIVSAYQPDLANGHVHLSFQSLRSAGGEGRRGASYEAMLLFLSLLFETFPLHILFARVPRFNRQVLAGLVPDPFDPVGSFPEYFFHDGGYEADDVFALRRAAWEPIAAAWFKR